MTKEKFAEAIFRIFEIFQEIELSDTMIGQCGQCRGLDEPNYFNLCPDCYEVLEKMILPIGNTPFGIEFRMLLESVQDALEGDNELMSVLISSVQGSRCVH